MVAAYNFAVFNTDIPAEQSDDDTLEGRAITIDRVLVQEALRQIVSSRHFQTSRRGKEFLQYVVNQKNNGHGDLLKERLIGVHLFGRKPDYSTGEDPVVRVQAGDVRRRLERYYADPDIKSEISIQIPLGSYAPVFSLRSGRVKERSLEENITLASGPEEDFRGPTGLLEHRNVQTLDHQNSAFEQSPTAAEDRIPGSKAPEDSSVLVSHSDPISTNRKRYAIPVLASLVFLACICTWYFHHQKQSIVKAFWAPAATSSKPVLLCLPRPMVYRPSDKLFDGYGKSHPNSFVTRESRQDQVLPLEPTDPIQWGDMVPVRSAGPGIGGVVAAINMSRILTEQGIRFELRFGKEATYAEMRDSPVVIIGGINTEWATQLISETSFAFDESRGSPNIHETGGAKRVWKQETSEGQVTRDYGLITRQLSGRAGQFLVQVAGISHFGTAAASEILVQPQELEKILRSESVNLQKKNLQIVVSTDVTDERAGPPHVVAISTW